MKLKAILILSLILLVNGCSILFGPKQAAATWSNNESGYKDFTTNGRLSVNFDGKGYSAHFLWQKNQAIELLDVSTPIGGTVGQICQDKQGLIAASDSDVYTASSIEDLTQQLMGISLPLDNLSYWVQGAVVPNQAYQIDQEGNLSQLGWKIKRTVLAIDKSKTRRLELTRRNMDIRIVFDDFDFSAQPIDHKAALCEIRARG